MDKVNLKRLREKLLELEASQLNMDEFESLCGTVKCVAGWAKEWFGKEARTHLGYLTFVDEFLDLPVLDCRATLWICSSEWAENFNTIEHAVKRIDYLLEHGAPPEDYSYHTDSYYSGELTI